MVRILSVQLNEARTCHKRIHGKQIVVFGDHIQRIFGPYNACGSDSHLHRQGHLVWVALHVSQIRDAYAPFKRRGPEKYRLRSCWMIPDVAQARSEAGRHVWTDVALLRSSVLAGSDEHA